MSLQSAIFSLKAEIIFKLQDLAYQTNDLQAFRESLVNELLHKVQELNKENFAVRQHLRYVEKFSISDSYLSLSNQDLYDIKNELAPLILPDNDDPKALRFDALMYGIELCYLNGKMLGRRKKDLIKNVAAIASVANIPEINAQSELIDKILHTDYVERGSINDFEHIREKDKILHTDYVERGSINDFEHIREKLRDLMKYIPYRSITYTTNFADEVLSMEWKDSELENDDLQNYKEKVEFYIRQHQDSGAIAKLRGNIPLTKEDVSELEELLWKQLGSKEDYEKQCGNKPLGAFVRSIVGMDMNAAKEAFSEYLNDVNLDERQIYFVNQIVEYIVQNGMITDMSVLQSAPFTNMGSVVEVFSDLTLWMKIKGTIQKININANVA